jgi:hypothetical protein
MTGDELRRLIEDHARFPEALRGLVPLGDVVLLREREAEDRRSPLEILAHIEEEERRDFRVRARVAAEGRPFEDEDRIDPEGWVTAHRYNDRDPHEVLDAFARERADSVAWLRTLDVTVLERTVEIPQLGAFRCGDFITAWRVHDLLTARQLSTALTILTARRLGEWRVDYAGTIPAPARRPQS